MKKLIVLLLALLLSFGAAAETPIGIPNPITEYETLAEINEIVGSNLCHPAVMGVTDESFAVIDCGEYLIAQYRFAVNGLNYTFRCAAVAYQDISGVYINAEPAFADEYSGETEFAFGEGLKLARWLDINGQYTLCLEDGENVMDEETFKLIALEMEELTSVVMTEDELAAFYEGLSGAYEDSYSQRASCEVTAKGSEGAQITVHWGDSAWTHYAWTMTVKLGEDGLLYYDDCALNIHTADDSGNETMENVYENGRGFFSYDGEKLYWNGAEDENCRQCVFEPVPAE